MMFLRIFPVIAGPFGNVEVVYQLKANSTEHLVCHASEPRALYPSLLPTYFNNNDIKNSDNDRMILRLSIPTSTVHDDGNSRGHI